MKLFLKRDVSDISSRYVVLDDSGKQKYIVTGTNSTSRQKLKLSNANGEKMSEISLYSLVATYFMIKYDKRIYALVPCMNERLAFLIYGSTLRFFGDIAQGRFSLIDVDKSVVMNQKKCWGKYGTGFELNIIDEKQEIFALSVAICADMYLSAADKKAVLT